MTINLNNKGIDPRDLANFEFLNNLQGNILKGHGRNHTNHLFFNFGTAALPAVKAWIKNFAEQRITSALTQLKETEVFKRNGVSGKTFFSFYLSAKGISFLNGHVPAAMDPAFVNGMKHAALNDPAPAQWETGFQGQIDAMILIADDDPERVGLAAKALLLELETLQVTLLTIEYGNAIRNDNGDGLEHFGYVDGISQPLFLKDDVANYQNNLVPSGTMAMDLSVPLKQVLIYDPLVSSTPSNSCGSYFVFRKLEQQVQNFKKSELQLADSLGLVDEDRERAGAMIVGRFEDGTPVTLNNEAGMYGSGMSNNFTYGADTDGAKCPFHSHIRKANPRDAGNVARMMARRGIPFGLREVNTDIDPLIEQMPNGGVGLLFMSFQDSITDKFEFIQKNWVNSASFPSPSTGIDPIIGQTVPPAASVGKFAKVWGDKATLTTESFNHFVTMKGGEYFYAPSLTFLTK